MTRRAVSGNVRHASSEPTTATPPTSMSPHASPQRPATVLVLVAAAVVFGGCDDGDIEPAPGGDGIAVPDTSVPASPIPERAHVLDLDPLRPGTTGLDSVTVAAGLSRAESLERLHCLLVARDGEILVEWCRDGYRPDGYANVKSVSKSVISALVGIAVAEGHLEGRDQRVATFFETELGGPAGAPKVDITLGHLLSMQSGLERTSGGNYGAWVSSADWVRDAIRRPMVAEPGGRMLYSTGNYHLLSSILTEATGRSTLAWAREVLGGPLEVTIPAWLADPQGIYFGGNEMRLTPRAMVRFGELYRNEGRWKGGQVVPRAWVRTSLEPRTHSRWSGEAYGYGWFLSEAGRWPMFFAWGYGGQFIFVVPDLSLTMVTTSNPVAPRGGRHNRALHAILDDWIVPAAEMGDGRGRVRPVDDGAAGRARW